MPTGLTFQTTPTSGYNGLDEAYTSTCAPTPSPRSRPPRLSPSPDPELYRARERIRGERNRQRYAKNYTLDHDSRYVNGELVRAAKAYEFGRADLWPWALESFKPRGEIENLTRAGALWMVERDRASPSFGSEEAEALASHDCDIEINRIARKIQFLLDVADEDRRIRSRVVNDYCGDVAAPSNPCDTVSGNAAQQSEQPSMGHWTGGVTPATAQVSDPVERSGHLRRAVQRLQEAARSNPCHDQVRATTAVNSGWNTVGTSYPNRPSPRAG